MIVGIGTDLIEIGRVQKMVERKNRLSRIFSEEELAYAGLNSTTLCCKRSRFQSIWNRLLRIGAL